MVDNSKENRMSIDDFDFAHEDATDDTPMLVNYLVTQLQQAMGNPAIQGEEKSSRKKKERKRSPYSPSSSPSSSFDKNSGYSSQEKQRRGHQRSYAAWKRSSKLKKFKEGGKNIPFLTYDGTFGATNKVIAFIQQFDAAFGDKGFMESSKLHHIAMHFLKSARQWWASLRANGEAPKTWKALRASIMKQFFATNAKEKVLTKWRSIKFSPYESICKYVDKFWDLHLKAIVYKKIDFEKQKQQFCAGLPKDMNEYVNSQRPRSISTVIHHTMVAARINFQQGTKRNLKSMEAKDKQEYKGKNLSQNSFKGNSNNNKAKEKGVFKGTVYVNMQHAVVKLGILEEARNLGRCSKQNKVHLATHTNATQFHLCNKSSRDDDPSSMKENLSDSQNQGQEKVPEEEEEGEQQDYKNPLTAEIGGPKGSVSASWETASCCSRYEDVDILHVDRIITEDVLEDHLKMQGDKLDADLMEEPKTTSEDMQVKVICGTVSMTMLVKRAIEIAIVVQLVQSLSRKDEVVLVEEEEQVCLMAHEKDSQVVTSSKPSKEVCASWLKGMLVSAVVQWIIRQVQGSLEEVSTSHG
ncbi:hypothetical protein L7F22_049801 [Adiantum nelumboides]|nr:hypothetical protein [Adiantum nelumboides]